MLQTRSRGSQSLRGRVGTRDARRPDERVARSVQSVVESLEPRQLLAATPWPGYGSNTWPAGWANMEIECKWRTEDEQLIENIWATFSDASSKTINMSSIGQSYLAERDWSGNPRRYMDLYYDNANNDLANAQHTLRHRRRYRAASGQTPTFTMDLSALDTSTYWASSPDKINVQYKSTPERFHASWFRMETGAQDLSSDAQATLLLQGNESQYPGYPGTNADNPVLAAKADHPSLVWLGGAGGITDNIQIRQFRSRTTLKKYIGGVPESSMSFELTFDKVREYTKDGGGAYTVLADEYFILEMSSEQAAADNLQDMYSVMGWVESSWTDLTPDPRNKAGFTVPDHGPIVIDNGERGYSTTGTWSTLASGFKGDAASNSTGTGSDVAVWDLTLADPTLTVPLSPGRYKIGATWPVGTDPANNTPIQIYDGATLLGTITKNQTIAPAAGYTLNGTNFEDVGDTFYLTGTQLVVKITDNAQAGKNVIADAILVQHVDEARVGIAFASGALSINGTSGGDSITLAADAQGYVTLNTGSGASRIAPGGTQVLANSVTSILVEGLEGIDTINLAGVTTGNGFGTALNGHVTLMGGDGNDVITGTAFNDGIFAGAGDDRVDGGAGADDMYGDAGTDIADYYSRTTSPTITFNNLADDGDTSEGDNVRSTFENAWRRYSRQPASVSATPVNSSGQTTITWTGNYIPGDVVHMEYYNDSNYTWVEAGTTTASGLTGTISGLNPRFSYSIRIHARSSYGNDTAYSNTSAAATQVPVTPTNLTATEVNQYGSSTLRWQGSYGSGDVVHVERSSDGVNFTEVHTTAARYLYDTISGLSQGVSYYFRVRVTNSVGSSGYSNVTHIGPLQPVPTPYNLTASSVSQYGTSQLNWQGGPYDTNDWAYIEQSTDGVNFTYVGYTYAAYHVGTVSNLQPGGMYYFRIHVYDPDTSRWSSYSNTATTIQQGPVPTPYDLTASTVSQSGYSQLNWQGGPYDMNDWAYIEKSTDGVNFTYVNYTYAYYHVGTVGGLTPGGTYYFRVHVYDPDISRWSGYSNTASTVPQPSVPTPYNLTASTIDQWGSTQLNWEGGPYDTNDWAYIEQSTDGVNFDYVGYTYAAYHVGGVGSLQQGTTYYFRVHVYDEDTGLWSDYSNVATTTGQQGGFTPYNLTASSIDQWGYTQLNWEGGPYDMNDVAHIEQSTDGSNFQEVGTTYAYYLVGGAGSLQQGTTYYFRVRVYDPDSGSWSDYSNIVSTS